LKKYLIVYNSGSGRGRGEKKALKIGVEMCRRGVENISLFETHKMGDIADYFAELSRTEGDLADYVIIVIGGDGTLGSTIYAIVHNNLQSEVAIYPHGTANDFATSLHASRNIKKFVDLVLSGQTKDIDVANVNNEYAINAIGGGNFSHGGEVFSARGKRFFGKFAYYLHCFFVAFSMKSQKLKVQIDDDEFVDDFIFYYIVNSNTAGGFKHFAPNAQLADGNFVFVGVKKCSFIPFCFLFFKILFGTHGSSKKILMKKGQRFSVTPIPPVEKKFLGSDLDGNVGPMHPLNVRILRRYIKVYAK